MMAAEYKKRGGDYNTPKSDKDESAKNLDKWNDEDWQTKDGEGQAKKPDGSRKRYLPEKAWEEMDEGEKEETDQKKQKASKAGQQYVANTGKAKRARKNAHEEEGENGNDDEEAEGNQAGEQEEQGAEKLKRGRPKKTEQKAEEESDTKEATKSASTGRKRGRPKKEEEDEAKDDKPAPKKGKSNGKTVGSRHDKAEPPAKQASLKRLPKKGQNPAYWKAMPGWVDGEVVEIVKSSKKVDG
jgi:hypothetical protein